MKTENENAMGIRFYSLKDTACSLTALNTSIKAGFPSPAADYMEEDIDLKELLKLDSPNIFLARIDGDSMKDAYVPHGSYIVVDRSKKPQSQQIVVAILNGEFTVKRLVKSSTGYILYAANSMFDPIVINGYDTLEIWGVVIRVLLDPNHYL